MVVSDGAINSPNETEVMKKILKVVAENKELKEILRDNSARLQKHVDDCIRWKNRHNDVENGLRKELQAERETTARLNAMLEHLNMELQGTTTHSNQHLDDLVIQMNESKKLCSSFDSYQELNATNDQEDASSLGRFQLLDGRPDINLQKKNEEVLKLKEELTLVENSLLEANKNLRDKEIELSHASQLMEENLKKCNEESNIDQSSEIIALKEKEIYSLSFDNKVLSYEVLALKEAINDNQEYSRIHQEALSKFSLRGNGLIDVVSNTAQLREGNIEKCNDESNHDEHPEMIGCNNMEIDSLSLDTKGLKDEISRLRDEIAGLKDVMSEMADNSQECNRTRQELMSDLNLKEKDLNEVKEKLMSKESELSNIAQLLAESEILCKENQVEYERKLNRWKKREAKDADKINALKKEISELKGIFEKDPKMIEESKSVIDLETESIYTDAEVSCLASLDSSNTVTDGDIACAFNQSKEKMNSLEDLVSALKDENAKLREEMVNLEYQLRQSHEEHTLSQSNMQKRLDQHFSLENRFLSVSNKFESMTLESNDYDSRSKFLDEKCELLQRELGEANNLLEKSKGKEDQDRRELSFLKAKLETEQHNNEKLKRDVKNLVAESDGCREAYDKLSAAFGKVTDELEVKYAEIDQTKATLGQMPVLYDVLKEKDQQINEMKRSLEEMPMLHNELLAKNQQMNEMKRSLEEMEVLRMQGEVYKNDFRDEREARGKQQTIILDLEERNQKLMAENVQLRENNEQIFRDVAKNQHQQQHPQQQQQVQQQPQNQQPQGYLQSMWNGIYQGFQGKKNEQEHPPHQQNRHDAAELRICPKCHQVCPDPDSLQIHVMECLDK